MEQKFKESKQLLKVRSAENLVGGISQSPVLRLAPGYLISREQLNTGKLKL